jgi:hypothetical protein
VPSRSAGDPPQIKLAPATAAASGDFTLAEMLLELRKIRERKRTDDDD